MMHKSSKRLEKVGNGLMSSVFVEGRERVLNVEGYFRFFVIIYHLL